MKTARKIALTLIMLLLFGAGAAYAAGRVFFKQHFLPGTTLNGMDCSYMTVEEAEGLLDREIKTWALAVDTMYNGREAVSAMDVGMGYDPDGSVEKLLEEQDLTEWFLRLGDKKELSAKSAFTVSDPMIERTVDGLRCMQEEHVVHPQNAYVMIEGDDTFTVVSEINGNALDRGKVIDVIRDAALNRKTEVSLEKEGCYLKPAVTSDSPAIRENLEKLNHFKEALITYDFADHTERVDWTLIKDWITFDDNGNYILDEEKVRAYVKTLGEKYNTFGKDREFLTYDNRKIMVTGGDFGWLIDDLRETQGLIHAIEAGTVDVREPVYAFSAGSRSSINDLGVTYIEVDLKNERLIYYEKGNPIVDTPVVVGFPHDTNTLTPTGMYAVTDKKSPSEITENGETLYVNYYLDFYYGSCICDAPWRAEFGGDVSFWDGTDGGVEVPTDAMAVVYEHAEVGTPVVIYDN